MKSDIRNRADIELLVEHFYQALLLDETMQHIFLDVAQLDMKVHKPILCDFWESILFGTGGYNRNTMQKHLELHQKHALLSVQFEYWLERFEKTVSILFLGQKATEAKEKARAIASTMQIKIAQLEQNGLNLF